MASLQRRSSGLYHIIFRFQGDRFNRSLKTKDQKHALARKFTIEETIRLLQSGRLELPADADLADFILADGKPIPSKDVRKNQQSSVNPTPPPRLTLQSFFDQFFTSIPDGNLEESTLYAMHIHKQHFLRILKPDFLVQNLTLPDLQKYVNTRSKETTHYRINKNTNGKHPTRTKVTATTISKELVTFGTAWRWAESVPLVTGRFPRRGLRLPKSQELPPFQTWDEIERQITHNELQGYEADRLWDALYLRRSEIDELLTHVESTALYPFIYPLFVFATHTGARRSEMLRSRRADFDFSAGIVTIQERKRVRGKHTSRRVPMSPTLRSTMQDWFTNHHPGGPVTFCHSEPIRRSRTHTQLSAPVTRDQIHDHFQRTLANSRWQRIRGWHCFRHSFISNMACNGVDQRIIDEFVGHTTEQMRRRYRHLFPDVKQAAIDKVFG